MSKFITKINKIWQRFSDKEYRDSYVSSRINESLSAQIYYLRTQFNWSQYDLAEKSHMAQPRISVLERSCEGVSISTLKKLASAFDVALSIKFVPFSSVAGELISERIDQHIRPYTKDISPAHKFDFNEIIVSGNIRKSQKISASNITKLPNQVTGTKYQVENIYAQ